MANKINESNYTEFLTRKPPNNIKVMMLFWDGTNDICYIDDWGIIHGQSVRIYKNVTPKAWKKIERDEDGEYLW